MEEQPREEEKAEEGVALNTPQYKEPPAEFWRPEPAPFINRSSYRLLDLDLGSRVLQGAILWKSRHLF